MSDQTNITIPKTQKIKLLSQGAYGCIFRPGPSCKPNQPVNSKFITKVQRKLATSKIEEHIGNLLKEKYPATFQRYFAPVIDNCLLDVSTISSDEAIQKCDFLHKSLLAEKQSQMYESNQIQYVGKYSLADFLNMKSMKESKEGTFLTFFLNTHITLLEALAMMVEANIVHLDLKENNIICKDKTGRPIIIDFGMSIDTSNIETAEFDIDTSFFTYGPDYDPWCVEIAFITFMVNELGDNWKTQTATLEQLTTIINEFTSKNPSVQTFLTEEEKLKMKEEMLAYFKPFDRTLWKTLYDSLIKSRTTWDNNALAIIYLHLLKDLKLEENEVNNELLKNYKKLLKDIIMSMPDKRKGPEETKQDIAQLFKRSSRIEIIKLKKTFQKKFKNVHELKERQRNIANKKIMALKKETSVRSERESKLEKSINKTNVSVM